MKKITAKSPRTQRRKQNLVIGDSYRKERKCGINIFLHSAIIAITGLFFQRKLRILLQQNDLLHIGRILCPVYK